MPMRVLRLPADSVSQQDVNWVTLKDEGHAGQQRGGHRTEPGIIYLAGQNVHANSMERECVACANANTPAVCPLMAGHQTHD